MTTERPRASGPRARSPQPLFVRVTTDTGEDTPPDEPDDHRTT